MFDSLVKVVAALVVIGVTIKFFLRRRLLKKMNIPSVGGGLPFFGHVFTMMKGSPWDTMAEWVHHHGMVYRFHLFGSDAICVGDPDALKVILHTKLSNFKKDVQWTYHPFMVLLGNGLVTSEGDEWRRQRHLLSHHLRVEVLHEIPEMALKAVERLSVKLRKAAKEGKTIEMAEEFRHLTLQVISEALLSLTPEESDSTFAQKYLPIMEEGNLRTWHPEREYIPNSDWFAFQKAVKNLNEYVEGLISKRWELKQTEAAVATSTATSRKHDILDKILEAIPVSEWSVQWLHQVRDEIKTFVLAGHETSASMLTWSLYELSINKPLLQQARQEADSTFDKQQYITLVNNNKTVTTLPSNDELTAGLSFTECCLRESLRKYSNVPSVVRVAHEDIDIDLRKNTNNNCNDNNDSNNSSNSIESDKDRHYFIPKGSTIMINMQGVHHNPNIWPEPLKYDPLRFQRPIKPFTYLPFIDGPRMCLGQFLALLESKIVLSVLLLQFDFTVQNTAEAGLKHSFMVPIIPKNGHHMKIDFRQK